MCKQKPISRNRINKQNIFSWSKTNNSLVSQTLNIYANAINSSLCNSPTKPLANVNSSNRILNQEGYSWQKGYRTPLASISYKNTYYKFIKALHLVIRVLKKGGEIYVIFDENQLRPCSSFCLDASKSRVKQNENKQKKQTQSFFEKQKQESLESGPNDRNIFGNKVQNIEKYENITWSDDNWVGGSFSNKKQVSKSINLYKTLSRQFSLILEKSTSPRYLALQKKFIGSLFSSKQNLLNVLSTNQGNFSGYKPTEGYGITRKGTATKGSEINQRSVYKQKQIIKSCFFKFKPLPDLIIVENAEKHRHVIAEAEILKIPLIAFVESDFFSNISIALPLNGLKHYFLAFLLHVISKMPTS